MRAKTSPALLVVASLWFFAPAAVAAASGFAGHWDGAIIRTLARDESGISLDLEAVEKGGWSGRITIPLIGIKDRPLDKVAVEGSSVAFEFADDNGRRTFQGKLSEDGDRIVGEFKKDDHTAAFELDRQTKPRVVKESELHDLSADARELKTLFDQQKDKLRIILLLSPT